MWNELQMSSTADNQIPPMVPSAEERILNWSIGLEDELVLCGRLNAVEQLIKNAFRDGVLAERAILKNDQGGVAEQLRFMAQDCDNIARFIREQTPQSLDAWSKRISDLPISDSLPARRLDSVAADLRKCAAWLVEYENAKANSR